MIFGKLFGSRNAAGDTSKQRQTGGKSKQRQTGGKSRRTHRAGRDDDRFGTGLWRQHRDRCMRAIDRFYETTVALHKEAPAAAQGFVALTHELNGLAARIDSITEQLHAQAPIDSMTIPATVRAQVGQAPELMSMAGGKIAEAAQVAAMFRAQARSSAPSLTAPEEAAGPQESAAPQLPASLEAAGTSAADKAARFIADARDLLGAITITQSDSSG